MLSPPHAHAILMLFTTTPRHPSYQPGQPCCNQNFHLKLRLAALSRCQSVQTHTASTHPLHILCKHLSIYQAHLSNSSCLPQFQFYTACPHPSHMCHPQLGGHISATRDEGCAQGPPSRQPQPSHEHPPALHADLALPRRLLARAAHHGRQLLGHAVLGLGPTLHGLPLPSRQPTLRLQGKSADLLPAYRKPSHDIDAVSACASWA